MLVLSRKVGESVCIGNDVIVTVTRASAGKVRLAIEAPAGVHIRRNELLHQVPPGPRLGPPARHPLLRRSVLCQLK